MKIPFTLDAWLKDKSQKVVDEDGRPVRIICTDADGLYPIIGLVDNKIPLPCGKDGRPPYIGGGGGTLFIVTPEEELTEFEKKLWEVLKSEGSPIGPIEKFTDDDKRVFHAYAAKLLAIARKELCEQIVDNTKEAYENGKAEALKDLPRWDESQFEMDAPCVNFEWLHVGKKMIYIPDLEKLPGFKEDSHE